MQDIGLLHRVVGGLSCRDYEAAAEAVPEAFGLARSSVSRRLIRASAPEVRQFQERRLDTAKWLVLALDGKAFAGDQLVVALGVTTTRQKRILGLVQTASENRRVIATFLRELVERSFPLDQPLLAVLDGAKGLRATVRDVFGAIPVQRCQWHKRESVVRYFAKSAQPIWRRKLQAAYAHPTYSAAKRELKRLYRERPLVNESAAASLAEGLEETLTLHRLRVFPELEVSFKTTNPIQSVTARREVKTQRVTRWRTSDQKLRWRAAACWTIERRFRRVALSAPAVDQTRPAAHTLHHEVRRGLSRTTARPHRNFSYERDIAGRIRATVCAGSGRAGGGLNTHTIEPPINSGWFTSSLGPSFESGYGSVLSTAR